MLKLADAEDFLRRNAVIIFFLGLLILGGYVSADYGLTCDEPLDRRTAAVNLKYLLEFFKFDDAARALIPAYDSLPALSRYVDRDYGVLFHLPAYVLELIFYPDDAVAGYHLRHELNFLYVFTGLVCFYLAIRNILGSRLAGVLGVGCFLLTPRFFAESFYNGKDLIAVAFVMVNLWTLTRYLLNDSAEALILHALSTALLIDVRVIGTAFLVTSVGLIVLRGIIRGDWRDTLLDLALYLPCAGIFTVIFFPYLWEAPFSRFIEVFHSMSSFRHEGEILFMGEFFSDHQLPASYVPVWIGVTVPPVLLLAFGCGLARYVWKALYATRLMTRKCYDCKIFFTMLFCAVVIFGSLLSVILMNSSLYNGWRQMYFIYPPMIMFMVLGLMRIGTRSVYERYLLPAVWAVAGAGQVATLAMMVAFHPFENVYFNFLSPTPWYESFDVDYWGNSTHYAYEFMLREQPYGPISYCHESLIFKANRDGLPEKDLERMVRVPCSIADFRVNNYFGRDATDYIRLAHLKGQVLYDLKVQGQSVLQVLGREP